MYFEPELKVVLIEAADVIRTSTKVDMGEDPMPDDEF